MEMGHMHRSLAMLLLADLTDSHTYHISMLSAPSISVKQPSLRRVEVFLNADPVCSFIAAYWGIK